MRVPRLNFVQRFFFFIFFCFPAYLRLVLAVWFPYLVLFLVVFLVLSMRQSVCPDAADCCSVYFLDVFRGCVWVR